MAGEDKYANRANYIDGDPKPTGAFIGQELIATNGNAWEWSGTDWYQTKAAGSVLTSPGDVNNHVINELFHLHTGTTSTLNGATAAGDTSIILNDATSFTIGDAIQINNGNIETTFPIITIKSVNTLTLDRPLDYAYSDGDSVEVVHADLRTTIGTLASPIIHTLTPEAGAVWHIERVIVAMTHSAAATDDKFGDQTALTNGVVLRGNVGGQFSSFTNWKTNGDLRLDMYDVTYSDKAGASLFGTTARGSFNRVGMTVRLDGDAGDYMDVLVQDDLTGLSSFFINGQGHLEA